MTIKPLIILPDPILREVSRPVAQVDDQLRKFAKDMLDTMYDAPGIGLAAMFVNPEVLGSGEGRSIYEEGCLSIPDYYAEVERPASVRVSYLDLQGKQNEVEADGLLATCLQHEIDHLNGVLFIDHISKLKRDMVVRKFKKLARDRPPGKLAV
jgi:peptide deformylase